MKYARPLLLAASTLALLISACSQAPANLGGPTLEPQFGTASDDIGYDVASVMSGRIYSLSEQVGTVYSEDGYENGFVETTVLRHFDGNGNVVWTKNVVKNECSDTQYSYGNCAYVNLKELETNSQGHAYALVTRSYYGIGDCASSYSAHVYKYGGAGDIVGTYPIGYNGYSYADDRGPAFEDTPTIAVDSSGNMYVAKQDVKFSDEYCTAVRSNVIAKYSANGALLWQRASTIGNPKDITVSGSGSVYVVGTAGFARYTNSGGLTWTKPGNFEEIIVSGSNLYTRYRKDIRKYDGTGKQLWLKSQTGLNTIVLQDMTGDGSGNVYLSGKYSAGSGNFNPMVRKLNSSGTVLWTKTYGTTAYDDARGVATVNGSEIYVTGETQGSLAHPNLGGPENRDGYLRKLNSSGDPVWTR